jgi:YVTN family beta-propeller protein
MPTFRQPQASIAALIVLGVVLTAHGPAADEAKPHKDDFEKAAVGKVPDGWSATKTGKAEGSVWAVVEDKTAPSGAKVLAQTAAGANSLFNLCVRDGVGPADVEVSVAFKANEGTIDQGGGVVWRYADADNYYVARFNPLEDNYRLYHVVNGKRTQIGGKEKLTAKAGEWHTLTVRMVGEAITCSLNGKVEIEVADKTFTKPGKVGLWTKADARTSFDDFQAVAIAPGRAEERAKAPSQVLAVNTGDGTLSVVDLATMKEIRQHKVGNRPYGIAVSRDGKTVAVGVEDEECVKFFSLPDFKLKGSTKIGKMFNDHIVLTQDGKHVLVANFYSDDVVGIDIETLKESFRVKDCSAPHVVKYGPLMKHAFVTCKKVTGVAVIDPVGQKQVKVIPLNVNPRSLTFSPDEKRLFFGSFWVDGFFELDTATGKVTKLHKFDPPKENAGPQEVTYHGVEMLTDTVLVAANEGRSYLDLVDVSAGKLLDRFADVSKPCCVERVPGRADGGVKVLVSNLGDGTLQLVELTAENKLKPLGKAQVGKAPKRVAFLP